MDLPAWSAALQALSIVVAAISVVIGISSWKRSLLGQKRVDLAEEVFELFLQARDAISAIRSPMSFSGEGSSRKQGDGETEEERKLLDQAFVAVERYNSYTELFSRLFSLKHRFSLYFGTENSEPFGELQSVITDILMSSRTLSRHWLMQGRVATYPEGFENHLERMRKAEAIYWDGSEDPDPINARMELIVERIEETCRRVVSPRPSFFEKIFVSGNRH